MVKMKNPMMVYKIIAVLAVIVAVIAIVQPYLSKVKEIIPLSIVPISELSTQGYTKVDAQSSAIEDVGVVSLTGNCYQLTATTEFSQAESIANGLENKIGFRPNTHDLMKDALDSLDINVMMVKIVDIRNSTFIGRLILKQGDKIISLDSRPSDGIALAVRTNASIYIEDNLLKEQGKYIC